MKLPRRHVLRAASGAVVALPLLESLSASAAPVVPTRLLIFATPQGTLLQRWRPATLPQEALALSELLDALKPHQSALTVISGVENRMPGYHKSNGHNAPGHTLMTAHLCENSADAQGNLLPDARRSEVTQSSLCVGPSFDHELARRLNAPLPLNLSVTTNGPGENRMWYRVKTAGQTGPNPEAPMKGDPIAVFRERLGAATPPTLTRADRLRGQRTVVMDSVRDSLTALSSRVSNADRLRLEAHADRLASLEQRLATKPPTDCGQQTQTLPAGYPTGNGARPHEQHYATAMIDVAVQALACNAARIVTLQFTDYHDPSFDFLPFGPVAGWHQQVHGDAGGPPNDNPTLRGGFAWYTNRFAYLLSQMKTVIEPNGASLLDNSLVLWMSEFGDGGRHSTKDLPIVLAGSLQGALRPNRHLARSGKHTGDLFYSLFKAFGVDPAGFGYQGETSLVPTGISGL
jgi:hypothetical protein